MKISTVKMWLSTIVPGIITAAVVFGPSKMTITSKMGAQYGTSLLWTVAVAILFMAVFTAMAGRIGRATRESFLSTVRSRWGKGLSFSIGIGIFLVTSAFQAGNAIGAGVAMAELTGITINLWVIVFTLGGIGLLFFRAFYRVLEKVMIGIVLLMLVSFLITCILIKPSVYELYLGIVPSVPKGSLPLVIAFTASCFSLVGALYQSYLVQEKARALKVDPLAVEDKSLPGIILLGLMSAAVMLCAAEGLHKQGLYINSAADMGKSLKPLFGSSSTALFLFGLLGAAVSSLIGNATVGGTLLSDALGAGSRIDNRSVKYCIAAVMAIGAVIALSFGTLPLELIIFAQSVTIFIVPVIGFAILKIANDKRIMGELRNSRPVMLVGSLGLLVIFFLAIINIKNLLL